VALQFRRGTEEEREQTTFVPLLGEPVYTTDTKRLYVGDGSTAGGNPVGFNNKLSDLQDVELISEVSIPISAIAATAGVVSIVTTLPHGLETGQFLYVYSTSRAAVNGVRQITVTGITSLTFQAATPDFPSTNDAGAVKYEPQDKAILAWDQATGKWGEQVYVYKLEDLGDVRITNPQQNHIIQYTAIPVGNITDEEDQIVESGVEEPDNIPEGLTWTQTGTISKFLNKQFGIGIDNLTDVLINQSTLSDNQILAYDSTLTIWKNQDYVNDINDLADVDLTALPDLTQNLARIYIGGSFAKNDKVNVQITGTLYTYTVTQQDINNIEETTSTDAQFDAEMLLLIAGRIRDQINADEDCPVVATRSNGVITLTPKTAPVNLNLTVSIDEADPTDAFVPTITKFEPITSQVLSYDGTKWTNKALEINNFSLNALNDVDIDNPENGQILQYNSTSSTWKNVANFISLSQFADVEIIDPENGNALIYNDTNDKFETRSFILDDLIDVNDPSFTEIIPDGAILAYDEAAEAWTPQQFSSLSSRTEVSFYSGPLENLEVTTVDFEAFTGYALFKMKASAPCTVTFYVSDYEREFDLDRAEDELPRVGAGIFAELTPTDTSWRRVAPVIYGFNDDVPITRTAYAKVRNRSGYYQQNIQISLVILQIEEDPEQAGEGD